MLSWCFSYAVKHFNILQTKIGQSTWYWIATEIRESSLVPATMKAYERGIRGVELPLNDPWKIVAYLDKISPSDSALKQGMAMANKIHKTRNWELPRWDDPLLESFISALKRQPARQ